MTGEKLNQSDYVQYLPAALQADPFLGQFLLAFEQILTGLPPKLLSADTTKAPPGLEKLIDQIHTYFDPTLTPVEFLPWLANWVALSLREDWSENVKRNFIRQIVPLYRLRGTKDGLTAMLRLYLENEREKVDIYEFDPPAHYFQVELELASQDLDAYRRKEKIARAIIDREKPAHTFYALQIRMPTMRLISAELAEKEGANPLTTMLRIGNHDGHNNNTILGTSSLKDLNIK
jgi:phage tail-like protein